MRHARHRGPLTACAGLMAAALALAGCTDSSKTDPSSGASGKAAATATAAPITINATKLTTDVALARGNPSVSFAGIIYGVNGDAFMAASRSDGIGQYSAAFWRAKKGTWSEVTVPEMPKGNLVDVTLQGGMISGTVADESGVLTPFILRSSDLEKWTRIDVPKDASGYRLINHAWGDDDTAYLLGVDGERRAVLLTQTSSGVTVQPVPAPAAESTRSYQTLAANGKTVVIGYYDGGTDEQAQSLAYVSTDGGKAWDSVTVSNDSTTEYVSGTYFDDHFVIAGKAAKSKDAVATVPVMWTSKDGKKWTELARPQVTVEDVWAGSRDLSTSFAGDTFGSQEAVVNSPDSPGLSLYLHPANEKGWVKEGPTLDSDSIGPWAMPMQQEKGYAIITSGNGELAVWRCTDQENWTKSFSAGKVSDAPWVEHAFAGKGSVVGLGNQQLFSYTDDGSWRKDFEAAAMEVRGSAIKKVRWSGVELSNAAYPTLATNPDSGAQVLAARVSIDEKQYGIQTWFRNGAKAWAAGESSKVPGLTFPAAVAWDGHRWVMLITENPDLNLSITQYGLATSTDGKKWSRVKLDAPKSHGAWPASLCSLGDGKLLAVGVIDGRPTGKLEPAAWVISGDSATAVPKSALSPLKTTGFSSCAAGPQGVVITDSSAHTVFLTKDGSSFEKVATFDQTDGISQVAAIPGGYALGGRLNTSDGYGPAIWLSKDAKHWQSAVLPGAIDADASASVATDGTDLVAVTTNSWPVQAWRVADTAKLLD